MRAQLGLAESSLRAISPCRHPFPDLCLSHLTGWLGVMFTSILGWGLRGPTVLSKPDPSNGFGAQFRGMVQRVEVDFRVEGGAVVRLMGVYRTLHILLGTQATLFKRLNMLPRVRGAVGWRVGW